MAKPSSRYRCIWARKQRNAEKIQTPSPRKLHDSFEIPLLARSGDGTHCFAHRDNHTTSRKTFAITIRIRDDDNDHETYETFNTCPDMFRWKKQVRESQYRSLNFRESKLLRQSKWWANQRLAALWSPSCQPLVAPSLVAIAYFSRRDLSRSGRSEALGAREIEGNHLYRISDLRSAHSDYRRIFKWKGNCPNVINTKNKFRITWPR